MHSKSVLSIVKNSLQLSQQVRNLRLRPTSIFSSPNKTKIHPPYEHFVQVGDPVLRLECQPIDPADIKTRELKKVLDIMKSVLKRYDGVGISAPQIGLPWQIMMIQFTDSQIAFWSEENQKKQEMEPIPLKIFINPKLHVLDKTLVSHSESCCSMHGYSALVPRYQKVRITALDAEGKSIEWSPSGWSARIVQHEFDHLQGKMFVDRAKPETLAFEYWKLVNSRQGDFKLSFDGIKAGPKKFMTSFFHQK